MSTPSNTFVDDLRAGLDKPARRASNTLWSFPASLIYRSGGKLHALTISKPDVIESAESDRSVVDVLTESVEACRTVIFAGNAVKEQLLDELDADVTEHRGLARQLAYLDVLGVSANWPVLTDMLARQFYLPQDADPSLLSSWADAFGVRGQATAKMAGLVAAALDAPLDPLSAKLINTEKWGLVSAAWIGSVGSAQNAFDNAETHQAIVTAINGLDHGLHAEMAAAGALVAGTVTEVHYKSIKVTATTPFRFKPSSRVLLGSPLLPKSVRAVVDAVELDEGDLVVHLTANIRTPADLDAVEGEQVQIVSEPFTGGARAAVTRWVGPNVSGVSRDVPVEVALAGAGI